MNVSSHGDPPPGESGGPTIPSAGPSNMQLSSLLPPPGIPAAAWSKLAHRKGDRWAIPERDADGEVIGTAYRDADGNKTSTKGGKRGLILSWPLATYAGSSPADPVFIAEGASDTAALLSMGFDAVGVPMAGQCGELLAELLAGRHIVMVADADDAGRRGAERIAAVTLGRCASVRVIEPPKGAKDVREAVLAGASRMDFLAMLSKAKPVQPPPAPMDGAPLIVNLSEVKPELVDWLWRGRIALGKFTLIAGDPGLGKSFLTLDIAARVSTGRSFPGTPGLTTTPGGVVLLTAEDGVADTIRPRLDAAGAEVSRIVALEAIRTVGNHGRQSARTFDLAKDLPALERTIQTVEGCRLVVIDPITAYLGSSDSHKNADIRGLLAPLGVIAERHDVAVVGVTHLNKANGGPAIYRAMGSLAFAAAARAAWVVCKDKTDPSRRLLLPMKNNIAPDTGGLAYRIEPVPNQVQPALSWEKDPVNMTADDALVGDGGTGDGRTERDDAAAWLRELLAHGPRPVRDIERDAKEAGYSWATVKRAKAAIGVASRKPAFGGPWEWSLPTPTQGAQPPEMHIQDAHPPRSEHLGEKQAEFDENPPKMLNPEGVSVLGDGDQLGNTAPTSGDGRTDQ